MISYRMLCKNFFPPVLLDQFEFFICVGTGVEDCAICDVEVAEAACKRLVRHCNPRYYLLGDCKVIARSFKSKCILDFVRGAVGSGRRELMRDRDPRLDGHLRHAAFSFHDAHACSKCLWSEDCLPRLEFSPLLMVLLLSTLRLNGCA